MTVYTKVHADWKDYPDVTTPVDQSALETMESGIADAHVELEAHIVDTVDAHDATAISIVDAGGYFTATDVEAALQEHAADAAGAHPASAISFSPTGTIAATDVQAAIAEVASEATGSQFTNFYLTR